MRNARTPQTTVLYIVRGAAGALIALTLVVWVCMVALHVRVARAERVDEVKPAAATGDAGAAGSAKRDEGKVGNGKTSGTVKIVAMTMPAGMPPGIPMGMGQGMPGGMAMMMGMGGHGGGKGSAAELPKPPKEYQELIKSKGLFGKAPEAPPPQLGGILGEKAMISGNWMGVGESNGDVKVKEIQANKVVIEYKGQRQELEMWQKMPGS